MALPALTRQAASTRRLHRLPIFSLIWSIAALRASNGRIVFSPAPCQQAAPIVPAGVASPAYGSAVLLAALSAQRRSGRTSRKPPHQTSVSHRRQSEVG